MKNQDLKKIGKERKPQTPVEIEGTPLPPEVENTQDSNQPS